MTPGQIKRGFRRNFERTYPYLISGSAAFVTCLYSEAFQFEKLLPISITVASTAAGFLTAAISILIGMKDSPLIENLRKNCHIEPLISYFIEALVGNIGLIAASSLLIIFNEYNSNQLTMWALIAGFAFGTTVRIFDLFAHLLREYLLQ
jgi:hypothetical protein